MQHPVRVLATSLVLTAASVAALHAQQAERFELPGTRLEISNLIGTLQVEAASGTTASAEVTRQGGDAAKLTVEQVDGTLLVIYPGTRFVYPAQGGNYETTIRVKDDGTFSGDYSDGSRGRKVTISSRGSGLSAWADVRLMLPAGAHVELNLGVGKVSLANVNGSIEVKTVSGDFAGNATTGELSIDTGSGDVTLTGHNGALSIDTGSGDITLGGIKTDELSVDTGSGDVRVDGLTASKLSVDTGSGDVTVSGASVGVVGVDTGSGDIRIGFSVDIDELSVDTGSGDVEVSAPGSLGATVKIETSSGDINTEFPVQVTRKSRDGLSGTIGDGQGRLSIDTASGDVTLKRQP